MKKILILFITLSFIVSACVKNTQKTNKSLLADTETPHPNLIIDYQTATVIPSLTPETPKKYAIISIPGNMSPTEIFEIYSKGSRTRNISIEGNSYSGECEVIYILNELKENIAYITGKYSNCSNGDVLPNSEITGARDLITFKSLEKEDDSDWEDGSISCSSPTKLDSGFSTVICQHTRKTKSPSASGHSWVCNGTSSFLAEFGLLIKDDFNCDIYDSNGSLVGTQSDIFIANEVFVTK